MADNFINNLEVPKTMAELEWVWVLSAPLSKSRDSIFVIDMDENEDGLRRRVVPIFEDREAAAKLKPRLCGEPRLEYGEQAMRLSDLGAFAARNDLEIMILDETGTILAHMEAKLERASIH
jgi:hypothetical protein